MILGGKIGNLNNKGLTSLEMLCKLHLNVFRCIMGGKAYIKEMCDLNEIISSR